MRICRLFPLQFDILSSVCRVFSWSHQYWSEDIVYTGFPKLVIVLSESSLSFAWTRAFLIVMYRLVVVNCHTTTKGPKWHSSLESHPTILFTYKAWVWKTRQMSLHRHMQRMIIALFVLYHDWTDSMHAGHFYWTLNLLCNRPLCKWYSWTRHKETMSLRSFCRGQAV